MLVFTPCLSLIIYLTVHCISDSVHFSLIRSFCSWAILPFLHQFCSHIDLPLLPRTIHPSILYLRIYGSIHYVHFLFFVYLSSLTLPLTQSATHNWNVHHLFPILASYLPYFSIDNAHPRYNAHPKLFRHSFWCIDNARGAN
jgi:hypothetical protein